MEAKVWLGREMQAAAPQMGHVLIKATPGDKGVVTLALTKVKQEEISLVDNGGGGERG